MMDVVVARTAWLLVAATACGRRHFDRSIDAAATPDVVAACSHTFCDDFDREGPIEAGWDPPLNTGGAMLTLASDASVSSPQSYLLSLPAPQLESGFLVKGFPLATMSARIAFAVSYASTIPGAAEVDLVRLKWNALPGTCTSFGYYLVRDGTGPFDLQETYAGCGGNENTRFIALDNTGFHAIVLEVTFGAIGTASIRVDIDGMTGVNKMTSHAIAPSTLTLQMGGGAVRNMSAPWQVRYDDVLVDLQ